MTDDEEEHSLCADMRRERRDTWSTAVTGSAHPSLVRGYHLEREHQESHLLPVRDRITRSLSSDGAQRGEYVVVCPNGARVFPRCNKIKGLHRFHGVADGVSDDSRATIVDLEGAWECSSCHRGSTEELARDEDGPTWVAHCSCPWDGSGSRLNHFSLCHRCYVGDINVQVATRERLLCPGGCGFLVPGFPHSTYCCSGCWEYRNDRAETGETLGAAPPESIHSNLCLRLPDPQADENLALSLCSGLGCERSCFNVTDPVSQRLGVCCVVCYETRGAAHSDACRNWHAGHRPVVFLRERLPSDDGGSTTGADLPESATASVTSDSDSYESIRGTRRPSPALDEGEADYDSEEDCGAPPERSTRFDPCGFASAPTRTDRRQSARPTIPYPPPNPLSPPASTKSESPSSGFTTVKIERGHDSPRTQGRDHREGRRSSRDRARRRRRHSEPMHSSRRRRSSRRGSRDRERSRRRRARSDSRSRRRCETTRSPEGVRLRSVEREFSPSLAEDSPVKSEEDDDGDEISEDIIMDEATLDDLMPDVRLAIRQCLSAGKSLAQAIGIVAGLRHCQRRTP